MSVVEFWDSIRCLGVIAAGIFVYWLYERLTD